MNEMGRGGATAIRGLVTSQIPDVEARSGVWNFWNVFGGWSCGGRDGGKRSYAALRESFAQTRHPGARNGVCNDMRSAAW